ncbi:MAG: 4Fe-4S dicluster domain-containing protein [Anaerolineae bacterium]|nr:4Fe-4S dicluster domain-containing protein [Anaerolineae bacterium]
MKATSRSDLLAWLDALSEQYTVIAPRMVDGELLYRPVHASDEVVLDFERTRLSAKSYLLPETEVILEIERQEGQVTLGEPRLDRDQVILLRPCDARALRALDALLLDRPPADAYYADRREKTSLIGLACPQLWDDCFCTSLGSAPDDASAVDVMVYKDGDAHLVEVITGKGRALMDGLEAEEVERPTPHSDRSGEQIAVLAPEDWPGLFDEAYWHQLAERCLSCHACTYVCPTCRCFDVRDDTTAAGASYTHIQRLRAWDSCMASAYRRIAGGHNPRPDKAQRLRNRYYCKFCYSPSDFGAVACVGCGRCIEVCPVGVDIAEMLANVAALAKGRSA